MFTEPSEWTPPRDACTLRLTRVLDSGSSAFLTRCHECQSAIVQRLGAIDALRAAIERAQRRGAALRRSVLERAFRGELIPQDPSDEPASVLLDRIRATREAEPAPRRGRVGRAAR